MNEHKIENLKKVRSYLENAWWCCKDRDVSNALDDLIDMVHNKIKEEGSK